jgi:hypothetical protein
MKKTIATLIAGLFATAAFAQTPAPAPATPSSTTPQSSVSPAVGKAEAGHEKQATKADAKDAKSTKSTKSKSSKKKGVKAKIKTEPEVQKDTAAADVTSTAPAQ